ncbi:T9SS type A sorting domain-containing protein [Flavobacterium sp. XS2P39]|uniref:T9SS type A sorting domain-containing protein n=1 Tax=Flavobacterium sp. XS2P39 TaxID=3401725 RepID=UPI003AABD862
MLVVILMTGNVSNGQSIKGVVPVQCPHGGSGVDGDAFADTPILGVGDLFDNNVGSGGGVINLAPPPEFLCSGPTFRLADAWGGDVQDPTIFTGSNKINGNPGDPDGPGPLTGGYTWGAGSSPNKNEIQNCGVHFTYGDQNVIGTVEGTSYAVAGKPTDLWCLFAGDRQVTNGSSYIDFEFLQATLSMFGTTSGGFVSAGTDGGRTLGDILVTIEFTQGGGDATVVIRRWEAKAGGGFEYVVRPNSLFLGGIYCTNNTAPTFVPFDVYGSGATGGTYAVNQWAEGAINLTKVFGLDQPGHECFVLSTVFIRTRSSGSSAQSELKDFPGAPIQLNLCTDEIPPVISALPGPTTVECPGTPSFATPTATDNCELKSLTFADVTTPGGCPQEYSVTRTWTATDACGNIATASQTIGVTDNTAPVLSSLPAPSTIVCPATPSFATPTATDACDASITPTFADVTTPGTCPQEYSVTRTWTATDDCGNSSTASQTISVEDNTAPVLSALPAPSAIECPATPVFTTPTATDACDASVIPTFADVTTPGSCPQEYSVTRTWTATDDCGNSSTASQTIGVTDNTAPVLSALPAPSSVECPATPVFTTPTATDACDASVTPTFADVTTPGSCPQEYSVTRTWTAIDDCGNSSTASQTIGVTDNTAPVLSALPAPSSVECPATPVFTTPTATDACDASVTPTFADVTTPGSCPQEYSVTRTWTATDDCGNSSTASQTIGVTDNTAPVLSALPAPSAVECPATPVFTTPTATDACDTSVTPTFADVTTPGSCPQEYSVTRTWTVTDDCGNSSTASQTIGVTDNTAPVLSALPAPSAIECPATPVFTTPTATDACDASVIPTFADVTTPGSCPQEYSVTRTWTATDDCGNSSTASQTIGVTDNTAPVLSALPAPSAIECPATPVFTTPTATDACDASVIPTFADVTTPGSCPQEYSVTRTWTATDDCGNSSTASQTIGVTDNTAPVLSALPAPSSVECPATPVFTTPTATDACDASVTPTFADVTTPGSCPQEYSVTRTWTAIDDCGNSSTASQTIGVTDNTAPVLSALPAPSSVECPATPVFTTPTATDACDASVTPTFADVTTPGSCPQEYSVTRTWTATDDCGNSSSASQTISVTDNTVPTITCVANKTIECNAEFIFDPPTATDSCSGTATITIVSTVTNADGSQTRTWKATDACGNESAPCSQTISVTPCAHIFPTQTTCCHFSTGTAIGLNNVCTTVSNKTVTNAIPGVFFYYSNITAPAANFTIVVKQSNDGDLNKLFSIQNSSQLRLFTSSCETVNFTGSVINGGKDASYSVTGATPGATYIVSVKYDVKSIIGAVYSGADLISKYTFASFINGSATAALGTTGTIDAVAGCSDNTPLPGNCSITAKAPTTTDVAPIDAKIENVGFDAYPVPFKDQLTIKYKFDYASDVKIELFNAQGILVLSKTDTHSYLNKEITLNLKANKGQEQVYIVKVTTNRGISTKKVMSSR